MALAGDALEHLDDRSDTVTWVDAVGIGDRGPRRGGGVIVDVEAVNGWAGQQCEAREVGATLVDVVIVWNFLL